jgi:SNF2 family DNA or RNA helicase
MLPQPRHPARPAARAAVSGKEIFLHAGAETFFMVRRIPGARWNTESACWSLPATPLIARTLANLFSGCAEDPQLLAILAPPKPHTAPPPKPVVVEVPPQPLIIPGLKTRPWRHQVAAWEYLQTLWSGNSRGAMLAMDMGTGKSLVAVAAAVNLPVDTVLIQCPLRVVDVWPEQFERHAERYVRVLSLGEDVGSVKDKQQAAGAALKLARARGDRLVLVINYESAWRDPFAEWALVQQWGLMIMDESHKIKSPSGKASAFCARLSFRSQYRLALTGTPLPHSHLDIFAQYKVLDRSIYGTSFYAFRNSFSKMGGYKAKQVIGLREDREEEFKRRMASIAFRVGKDVLDLPPTQHVDYTCALGREAARIYAGLERELIADVGKGVVTAANAMVRVTRLQQVTGGFVPVETELAGGDQETVQRITWIDDAKRRLLEDVLEDIGSEPVVVFCRFRPDMDAVHEAFSTLKISSLELSGRRDELAEWKQRQAQGLVVQIAAGGTGVDLTRARYAIYYSTNFSLADYDQSLSRTHRPGQTRPVTYIHLIVKGTVDERVANALADRANVIDEIVKALKGAQK